MKQIIRDVPDRIPQAEQRAEMQILEYLDQYYEIEKVLSVGKNIREYNHNVTYPGGIWIKKDGDIYKTLRGINGLKKPTKTVYWKQIVEFIDPRLIDGARKYSQLRMHEKGEVVMFGTEYWQCETPHGYEAGEVHLPGASSWVEAEVTAWEPNFDWVKDQVCSYNGKFYQYLVDDKEGEEVGGGIVQEEVQVETGNQDAVDGEENSGQENSNDSENASEENVQVMEETVLTPEEDDRWGLIGDYSEELEYDYSEGVRDYVVAENSVFYPVMNPNPDKLVDGENITRDDPRNQNIVAHMSRIALYHLHSIISPTNISETRRWAYEDSITWLYNASKFKINPQLPRKRDRETGMPKTDWACATFQRDYNPNENAWLI